MSDRIRDTRDPGFYIIDNEIIDNYGQTIGVYGIAAYNLLARFATSRGDNAFPSYDTIAQKLGISRRKAIDTVSQLVGAGLVTKTARKNQDGNSTSNLYTLVNIKGGGAGHALGVVQDMHQGSAGHAPDQDTIIYTPREKEKSALHRPHTSTKDDKFFECMCWIVGVDTKTVSENKRGELNQAKGILVRAGYTTDDLVQFWEKVWKRDFRWKEKKSRPTVNQLRSEIGKVKTNDNIMVDCESNDNTFECDPKIWDTTGITF